MELLKFSRDVLRRIARLDPAPAVSAMPMPRAPIGHGAAGVALLLAEVARYAEGAARRRAADQALAWIAAAAHSIRAPRSAYAFPDTTPPAGLGQNVFYGRAGIHTVAARVAAVRDDREALCGAARDFLRDWRLVRSRRDLPSEVFLGFAGFIHAARDFHSHAPQLGMELSGRVSAVGREAHARVLAALSRKAARPLRRGTLIGYAHGLIGEIDAVLAWDPHPSPVIASLLDRMLGLATVDGTLISWPAAVGGEACGPWWATWCNGVAGHVYLWCRAADIFHDQRYRRAARLAANTTATIRPGQPTVCCGTAGQALALHRYFQFSGDPAYRRLAVARARRACNQAVSMRESNLAYFGGLSGIAHLALTLHERRIPYLPLVEARPS